MGIAVIAGRHAKLAVRALSVQDMFSDRDMASGRSRLVTPTSVLPFDVDKGRDASGSKDFDL